MTQAGRLAGELYRDRAWGEHRLGDWCGRDADGGYTSYNIGVTGDGEGVLSLALDTAVTFADIAGNAGDSFTTGVTDVTGEMVIDTVHPTVTSIERLELTPVCLVVTPTRMCWSTGSICLRRSMVQRSTAETLKLLRVT